MVNTLLKDGYYFGEVWPDLNYEAMDRIIFAMKKPIDDEQHFLAFVDKQALVNGVDLETYRSGRFSYVEKQRP